MGENGRGVKEKGVKERGEGERKVEGRGEGKGEESHLKEMIRFILPFPWSVSFP